MDAVLRGAMIYFFILFLMRVTGKRSLGQMTAFDFVLLLIIAEATQQAMLGDDFSVTNALIVTTTLVMLDTALSFAKRRSAAIDKVLDSAPLVLIDDGRVLGERVGKAHLDEADILAAARELQGIERLEQIKYAVLERSGGISIVPKSQS